MSGRAHTLANLDTEMCVAAGCLINWAQLFAGVFFPGKEPWSASLYELHRTAAKL